MYGVGVMKPVVMFMVRYSTAPFAGATIEVNRHTWVIIIHWELSNVQYVPKDGSFGFRNRMLKVAIRNTDIMTLAK